MLTMVVLCVRSCCYSDAIIYCYGQSEEGRCNVCLVAGITFSDAINTLGICMPIISR